MRKSKGASIALLAILTITACGAQEAETDPLAPLTQGNDVVANSKQEEPETYSSEELLEGGEGFVPAIDESEDIDPASVPSEGQLTEEEVEEYWNETDILGIDPESINVPDRVESHFGEEPEITDTSRVARDTLIAVNHGISNITLQTQKMEGDMLGIYSDYMSSVLTSEAMDKLENSLSAEGDLSPWLAWYVAPFRPASETIYTSEGLRDIASSDYSWYAPIDNVEVIMEVTDREGDLRDGVLVSLDREYQIPLGDASKAVAFAINLNFIMVPDGFGKWIISDWFTSNPSETVLIDIEGA